MNANLSEFNRGAIRPVEALKQGWELIKSDYWLFLGITFVGVIIGSAVPLGILMGPMMCGIYLCLLKRLRGERVEFAQLFKGFDFFVDGLIAGVAHVLPIFVLIVPLYFVFFIGVAALTPRTGPRGTGGGDPTALVTFFIIMGVIFMVVMILGMVISALFMFSYALIVDRRLSGLNAIKMSARAVLANFGGVLGLLMLNMLLGCVGLLLCYVGAFLFMPIGMAAWVIAYRQVFPDQQAWGL